LALIHSPSRIGRNLLATVHHLNRSKNMRDYHGREITVEEGPDTLIMVWTIEPAIDTGYDYAVNRCYQDAMTYAQNVVENLMDDPDQEFPVTVKIGQEQMMLSDYEEICAGD